VQHIDRITNSPRRNPQTGRAVSIKTHRRAFATEIQTAKVELKLPVGRFIMDTLLGRRQVSAEPLKNERVRVTLAIFFAKTRMRWICSAKPRC
jgi:hypothetical protein